MNENAWNGPPDRPALTKCAPATRFVVAPGDGTFVNTASWDASLSQLSERFTPESRGYAGRWLRLKRDGVGGCIKPAPDRLLVQGMRVRIGRAGAEMGH